MNFDNNVKPHWNLSSKGYIVLYKDSDGKMKVWEEQFISFYRAKEIASVLNFHFKYVTYMYVGE